MKTLVVLFNLKSACTPEDYERWAASVDIPTVERLDSCSSFEVLRTVGTLGAGKAPYDYVELIKINDFEAFQGDLSRDDLQQVAAQFQAFADNPVFMLAEGLQG